MFFIRKVSGFEQPGFIALDILLGGSASKTRRRAIVRWVLHTSI
jgi:hypothetical protein